MDLGRPKELSKLTSWEMLDRLQAALGFDLGRWLDLLALTRAEYGRLRACNQLPSLRSFENLADQLNLDVGRLLSGEVDLQALYLQLCKNPTALPDRYTQGAFSRRRTSIHILKSIEARHGWKTASAVLRRLQVNESALVNPDLPISLYFLNDVCQEWVRAGNPASDLFEMGKHSWVTNFDSPLGREYRSRKTPKELFEAAFGELAPKYYDRNYHYSIDKMGETSCLIETTPTVEATDGLKTGTPGSHEICLAKSGTFASVPSYLFLPDAHVREVSCIHRGDSSCRYWIDFEESHLYLKSQSRISEAA